MRKFVVNFLVFFVFSTVFYVVVLSIWSWVMPSFMAKNVRNCVGCYGHLNTRIKEIPKYKNIDVLILGSSHAYRGFDTRVFKKHGLKAFNLGSSSQTPIQTNVLLNQYLDELTPKLVVLEVYAGTLEIDGVESSLDLAANNKMDWNYLRTLPDLKSIHSVNSAIYGSFRELFKLNDSFVEDSIQGDDKYVKGGYVETKFRKNPLKPERAKPWKIIPTQINYLKRNVKLLKSKEIPFVLVQTPISKKLYNSKTNNQEIDEMLSKLGKYKNFQGELKLNDTIDFYDSNHMNQSAVQRFDEYYIQYMEKEKLMKK